MSEEADRPRYRSGTVARMAKMPATTLRIWERRYDVSRSTRSGSGHRLYSKRELDRIVALRSLVSAGYAIGSIAGMHDDALQALLAGAPKGLAEQPMVTQVAAVGARWQPPADAKGLRWSSYVSLAVAMRSATFVPVDWLMVRETVLEASVARSILELADRSRASCVLVLYTEGQRVALDVLRMAGVQLLRERASAYATEDVLARVGRRSRHSPALQARSWGRAPRRFSDAEMSALAGNSSIVACECPKHLAQIIAQISLFESYSDECASDTPEDALLHRYLGDVSSRARELFEQALEHFDAVELLRAARKQA